MELFLFPWKVIRKSQNLTYSSKMSSKDGEEKGCWRKWLQEKKPFLFSCPIKFSPFNESIIHWLFLWNFISSWQFFREARSAALFSRAELTQPTLPLWASFPLPAWPYSTRVIILALVLVSFSSGQKGAYSGQVTCLKSHRKLAAKS